MAKKKKIRADFRKNRTVRARASDWTRRYQEHGFEEEAPLQSERISGKGELARRRTICGDQLAPDAAPGFGVALDVDQSVCLRGRVLSVLGLISIVEDQSGVTYQCATRRLLKTLATDQRHVVAAGDCVLFRPVENTNPKEGVIERVEPRHGCICRAVRGRQHVLVTNVDQLAIVTSVAEPRLKPNLIDRLLVTAEKGGVRPLICINKIDLGDPADVQPLVGVYSQMGYEVLLLSAKTGFGIERFRRAMLGRANVVAGQSGVGKSSLLNAIDPSLHIRVQPVSEDTEKGKHTTTTARLLPLGRRRIRGRHARHEAVPALGRHGRGGGGLFPRPAAVRQPVPFPRLHPHARGRLRREERRGRRTTGRTSVRELLSFVGGRR